MTLPFSRSTPARPLSLLKALMISSALALSAPAAAAPEPTQPLNDYFPRETNYTAWIYPHAGRGGPGIVGDEVRGIVTLRIAVENRYGSPRGFDGGQVIYTLDGVPISPRVPSPYAFDWDSTTVPDGTHALGVILVDGPADIGNFRVSPNEVVVDNVPGPVTGAQRLPVLGNSVSLQRTVTAANDWIEHPGADPRPHATVRPLPYRVSPPANRLLDPSSALVSSNWMLESLTEGNARLYQAKPAVFRNAGGHLVTNSFYQQAPNESGAAAPVVGRMPNHDGGRNANSVSPFSTYVPDPEGPGWVGVDLGGRVFRVAPDGAVTTLAGVVSDAAQIPYDYQNAQVTDGQHASARRTIGQFIGGVGFKAPTDLAFDPRNPKILYVADYHNHRIAKVDLSVNPPLISTLAGSPGLAGDVDGPAATARFDEPSSVVAAPDGTLYVADQENHSIRRISPDGSTVSTLVRASLPVPLAPFALRLDSNGDLVVAEFQTGLIKRVLTASGSVRILASLSGCNTPWTWLDVDRRGNVGPRDDILVACVTGGTQITYRLSGDGARVQRWPDGPGGLEQGPLNATLEPAGHYAWVVAIDDEESRIVYQGLGNMGLRQLRLRLPGDPLMANYGNTSYPLVNRGYQIMINGTVPGLPFGVRPTFTALLASSGHGHLGVVKNFDDLALMNDAELGAYIQAGMGGSVPRPEITGRDLDALIYYIRVNSLQGLATEIPLPQARLDTVPPVVSNLTVSPLGDGSLEVNWETDEPTIGFVNFGTSNVYHRWSGMESAYGTLHRAVLDALPADKAVHLAITAKDEAGNLTMTADREFTGGRTFLPTMLLEVTPTAVAYNGIVTLRWASTGADACLASGGWGGTKEAAGLLSRGPLTADTSFTLTCNGPGGSVSRTVPVSVAPPVGLPTVEIVASPASVNSGGSSTISWTTTNTSSCTGSNSLSGPLPLNGSINTGPITVSKIYTVSCVGPAGSASKAVFVTVKASSGPLSRPLPRPLPRPGS